MDAHSAQTLEGSHPAEGRRGLHQCFVPDLASTHYGLCFPSARIFGLTDYFILYSLNPALQKGQVAEDNFPKETTIKGSSDFAPRRKEEHTGMSLPLPTWAVTSSFTG